MSNSLTRAQTATDMPGSPHITIGDHHDEGAFVPVAIVGGGIVGLVLALLLYEHCGTTVQVYEAADEFTSDIGAGMGMYANGLAVLKDIDSELLAAVQKAGEPYTYRRWERHTGEIIMETTDDVLSRGPNEEAGEGTSDDDNLLHSLGIRRWKLQEALFDAAQARNIQILFGKRAVAVDVDDSTDLVRVVFQDGTFIQTPLLFGADGGRSTVRTCVMKQQQQDYTFDNEKETKKDDEYTASSRLKYSGVTCLMGLAPRSDGSKQEPSTISFPSSLTTNCHGTYFNTSTNEQCFQIHMPMDEAQADRSCWGTLSQQVSEEECHALATRLRKDGWHERYVEPLEHVTKAVRIGYCLLHPPLEQWVFHRNNVILVGDAAHPPVPYTGQGAQQGLEDAGTIALLLQEFCSAPETGRLDPSSPNLPTATRLYQDLRIPRSQEVLDCSQAFGRMQQKRADCPKYEIISYERIQRNVFYHETLPELLPGATFDYRRAVQESVRECHEARRPFRMPVLKEESFEP